MKTSTNYEIGGWTLLVFALICRIGGSQDPTIATWAIVCFATSSILKKLEQNDPPK